MPDLFIMVPTIRTFQDDSEDGGGGGPPKPTAPSLLSATPDNTVPNVALSWTQGTGTITSVKLYRQVNGGGYSLYQTLGVVTSYTDTGVAYGSTYDYKVLDHGPGGDSAFSNTGTAVVAVTPTTFATPAGWWKADSFALADGTAIGGAGNEWVDQMGVSNHYGRQATAANRPIFKTNIANGKPGILFTWKTDFTDQHFLDASNGADANSIVPASDWTVVAVLKASNLSTAIGGAICGNAYTFNNSLYLDQVGHANIAANDAVHTNTSSSIGDQTNVLAQYAFIRSAGNLSLRNNKVNVTSGAPQAYNGVRFNFIGAVVSPSPNSRFGGYFFELVIYASALTTAQLDSMYDNYFKPRWGLP